jgi:hypothetical protein
MVGMRSRTRSLMSWDSLPRIRPVTSTVRISRSMAAWRAGLKPSEEISNHKLFTEKYALWFHRWAESFEPVYSKAKHKVMSSEEYYASEFSDDYLAAQADAGDYFLNESGFQYRLNSAEISERVREGQHWLVIDKILGRDCGT